MLLFLMRHGIAEDPTPGQDDAARPLSAAGRELTARVAQGLYQLVPPLTLVISSPRLRARQTAELVCEAAPLAPRLEIWDELLLEDRFGLLEDKLAATRADPIMLVGHEPNLSRFASWLLTPDDEGIGLSFKKAGVCALEVGWHGEAHKTTLLWLATPKMLRKLAK